MLLNSDKLSFRSNLPSKAGLIDPLMLEKQLISTHITVSNTIAMNFIDVFCNKLSFTRNTVKTAGNG